MKLHDAYVGIGSNLGDRLGAIDAALEHLAQLGTVAAVSSIYRTKSWGRTDQPWFANAVVLLRTGRSPSALLKAFKTAEQRVGREPGERWGPRPIDLDLLLYDDLTRNDADLVLPHPRLHERAFVLVPLAEIDPAFSALRDALPASELAGVKLLASASDARANTATVESETAMADEADALSERIRALAGIFAGEEVVRVKIERSDSEIELRRAAQPRPSLGDTSGRQPSQDARARLDTIKADLVGIFHLSRPSPVQGEVLESDREIGYIEALGIRTPVHSMGSGRLVSIAATDGEPVEYGQPLFVMARG
ncbi:MAG: 2-amino-4-hydroxy-6-hydroxymethyldihydropteridine diphosphokinase [Candidatus Eremiobacteraeota bacterium]|nr:2-amino-4-hydroxy-6-hydroxymethyldihydropteridine diphosphokinase [Candidatus Eremiobacteraeota bacterium]